MLKRSALSMLLVCGLMVVFASLASGDTPAPGYEVIGRFGPTNIPPGGEDFLHLYVYNLGGGDSSTGPIVTNVLPAGLVARTNALARGKLRANWNRSNIVVTPALSKSP
jgi:hypothetical protein